MPETAGIHARIAAVMGELEIVGHDATMPRDSGGKPYASIDALRAAIRPLLAAHGVTVLPVEVVVVEHEERPRGTDRVSWDTTIRVTWQLSCEAGELGEVSKLRPVDSVQVISYGRSLNTGDKDYNTAHTYAERNMLISVFHPTSGEDPEQEPREDVQRSAPRGRGPDTDYHAPTAPADPPLEAQLLKAGALKALLVGAGVNPATLDEAIKAEARSITGDGRSIDAVNRAEMGSVIAYLEAQATKIAGYDPATGEVGEPAGRKPSTPPATPESPSEGASGAQGAGAPQAPQTPQAPRDAPARDDSTDADTGYREVLEYGQVQGLGEAAILTAVMDAGISNPAEFAEQSKRAAAKAAIDKLVKV